MAKSVPIPPAGFEDLTPDEKVQYVHDLWDYVVADASKVPVPDWHRRILDERLAEYHAAPHEGKAWPQVRDRLLLDLMETAALDAKPQTPFLQPPNKPHPEQEQRRRSN
jgi:putative addiction module component (TIGR02574 family)